MQVCKPGFVPRQVKALIIYLSDLPIPIPVPIATGTGLVQAPKIGTYLILQPARFAMRFALLQNRWALTPPFHLFPDKSG